MGSNSLQTTNPQFEQKRCYATRNGTDPDRTASRLHALYVRLINEPAIPR
jgi:hypothetical protein